MTYIHLRKCNVVIFVTGVLCGFTSFVAAEEASPVRAVEQQALTIIERASSFLGKQKQFSVSVEVWEDLVLENGSKIQLAKTVDLNLRRPDQFRVSVATMQPKRTFFYNGKSVTVLDLRAGFFGTASAPSTIDKTLAAAEENYGLTFPLDDLLMSDPYGPSAAKAHSGQYLGTELILGKECHHLAFQHPQVDWQAWVEEGPVPVLRKIVIDNKKDPGSPQFTAIFKSWDLTTEQPDYLFNFEKTSDFRQINMLESISEKASPAPQQ